MQNEKKTRKTNELIKVKRLIAICNKNNIIRIKYDNVEIEFGDKKAKQLGKAAKYEAESGKYLEAPNVEMPPDDVMLFAATDHFDDLLSDRKAAKGK